MTAVLLKFVHVLAIAMWSVGLLSLPFLYSQRRQLKDKALFSLHNFVRFFYIKLVSPAAFVAVVSGTALIFVESTFVPWFSVKLALVGAMVFIHVLSGLVILRLFEPGQTYPTSRVIIVITLTATVIAAILVTVLGKPQWVTAGWINDFFAPGALGEMLPFLSAWLR